MKVFIEPLVVFLLTCVMVVVAKLTKIIGLLVVVAVMGYLTYASFVLALRRYRESKQVR